MKNMGIQNIQNSEECIQEQRRKEGIITMSKSKEGRQNEVRYPGNEIEKQLTRGRIEEVRRVMKEKQTVKGEEDEFK